MRIRLHVGAHRTGTTTLQRILRENGPFLRKHRVQALTCWGFGDRSEIGLRAVTRMVESASKKRGFIDSLKLRRAKKELSRQIENEKTDVLVLSDENMLGLPFSFHDGFSVYPICKRTLSSYAEILPEPPERVHIAVRDYGSFLVSSYAMSAIYGKRTPEFSAIKDALLSLEKRWPDVLLDIEQAFPNAQVTYSIYEESSIDSVLHALLQPETEISELTRSDVKLNRSPTLQAIAVGLKANTKTQKDADRIVAAHASGEPFDPLSEPEKLRLREIYFSDLHELERNAQKVAL